MKIYFAAHSTSKDNEEEIASGWKDAELSELGIQQSKELGERFKDIKIDLICCSDLERAVDTVKIAFDDRMPIIIDKRLRELNYGDFNGKPSEEVGYMKKERIKEPFPNGESYEQAMERVHEFYKELRERHSDKTVLMLRKGNESKIEKLDENCFVLEVNNCELEEVIERFEMATLATLLDRPL